MLEKLQPKEHKNVTATKALKNFKNCNKSQQNLQLQNELQDIPPPKKKQQKQRFKYCKKCVQTL